jgi:hypothetical protein
MLGRGKRRRVLRLVPILMGLLAAVAALPAATSASVDSWPFQSTLTVCGDVIQVNGVMHVEWGGATTPSGGVIMVGHQSLSDVTAVNLTTGMTYHATGNPGIVQTSIITTPGGTYIYRSVIRAQLQATEGGQSIIFTTTEQLIVHPDGTWSSHTDPGNSNRSTYCD